MKTQKTPKPTTKRKTPTKKVLYDYHCDLAFREKPISLAAIDKLGADLFKWAVTDENATKIRPFFTAQGINSAAINRWKKRSKIFKRAYELSMAIIGDRREHGGLTKKYDSSIVLRGLSKYDEGWKALETWRSKMKTKEKENEKEPTIFNVTMPSFSRKEDEKVKGDN